MRDELYISVDGETRRTDLAAFYSSYAVELSKAGRIIECGPAVYLRNLRRALPSPPKPDAENWKAPF